MKHPIIFIDLSIALSCLAAVCFFSISPCLAENRLCDIEKSLRSHNYASVSRMVRDQIEKSSGSGFYDLITLSQQLGNEKRYEEEEALLKSVLAGSNEYSVLKKIQILQLLATAQELSNNFSESVKTLNFLIAEVKRAEPDGLHLLYLERRLSTDYRFLQHDKEARSWQMQADELEKSIFKPAKDIKQQSLSLPLPELLGPNITPTPRSVLPSTNQPPVEHGGQDLSLPEE